MRSVAVYIGSRANYSSAKPIMLALLARDDLELKIYLAGAAVLQKYGDLRELLELDGFKADFVSQTLVEGETPETMSKSIGLGVMEATNFLSLHRPDVCLAIGDRFDVLAWVVASTACNVIVAHTMGGGVSGTIDESIRHAITKFAHIHFPANQDAADRIIKLGENPAYVFNVGCPRIDVMRSITTGSTFDPREGLTENGTLASMLGGVGADFELAENFVLVCYHPVTTSYGSNGVAMRELLEALDELGHNVILIWPNADTGSDEVAKAIRVFREERSPDWLRVFINLPMDRFMKLMSQAICLVGNSSSFIREAAYVGTPSVCIGSRQASRLKGLHVINCEDDRVSISSAVSDQIRHGAFKPEHLYGDGYSGERIAEALATIELPSVQKRISY